MTGDIEVLLASGTYTQTSPIVFGPSDSGANGYTVIWGAEPAATPVISGGQVLSGWSQVPGTNYWSASTGSGMDPREFYVNGVRQTPATLPTGIPGTVAVNSANTGFTTTSTAPQQWQDPSDIEAIWNQNDWQESRCRVASVTGDSSGSTITMVQPCFANVSAQNTANGHPNVAPSSLVGSASFITGPGQWAYSTSAQKLYYEPQPGENLASEQTVIPRVSKLLDFAGTASTPVHNVEITNLAFEYATWDQPSGNNGLAVIYGDIEAVGSPTTLQTTPGNVSGEGARNVTVIGNTFTHLGAVGLTFSNGSQSDVITGNSFTDISAGGIVLGNAWDASATANNQNVGFTVTDNYVAEAGQEYPGSNGIYATMVASTTISHNFVTDQPYTGISIGYNGQRTSGVAGGTDPSITYAHDNVVSYNKISNTMLLKVDGAALYAFGPQSSSATTGRLQVFNNDLIDTGTQGPDNVANAAKRYGMYPDENSAYEDWYNNVVQGVRGNWLFIWAASEHDLNIHDNFSDSSGMTNHGYNITLSNNYTAGQPWPAGALPIIDQAGIEPAYSSIIGKTSQPIDDAPSSTVSYSGTWTHCTTGCSNQFGADYIGDTVSYTNAANSSVTVTWSGTQADFRASVGQSGYVNVSVDGGPATQIDLYSSYNASKVVWSTPVLPNGSHTLTITATGTHDSTSTAAYVALDAVIAHAPTSVDDSDSGLVYSGTGWTHCTTSCNAQFGTAFLGGTISYSNVTGDAVTYTWYGRQIAYYGSKGDSGLANVSIDGGTPIPVDLSSSSTTGDVLLFTSSVLTRGSHTITISVSGQHSGNNLNYISLDGLLVAP